MRFVRVEMFSGRLITILIFMFFLSFIITYHVTTNVAKNHVFQTMSDLKNDLSRLKEERIELMAKLEEESRKWRKAKDDREELSKRFNEVVRDYNLLRCSLINETTDTGAWCEWPLNNKHFTDESLAVAMAIMFENKTIASFGDGPGNYKKLLLGTGLIPVYDAYDGSPYIENATNKEVKYLDLTIPHFRLPIYDWVFSIEVAEHIPEQYEAVYLSNLIRHAREGLVISWARPHQLGVGHINLRPKEYVIQKLATLCFDMDSAKTNKLKRATTIGWIQMNLLVFFRRTECPVVEDVA